MPFPWEPKGEGSDEDLLKLVRSSIAQIVATGQSYGENGRQLTRADLPELRALKKELENSVAAASGGLAMTHVRFKRP